MPQWHPEQLKRGRIYEFAFDDDEKLTIEKGRFKCLKFLDGQLHVGYSDIPRKKGVTHYLPVVSILAVRPPRKGKAK